MFGAEDGQGEQESKEGEEQRRRTQRGWSEVGAEAGLQDQVKASSSEAQSDRGLEARSSMGKQLFRVFDDL